MGQPQREINSAFFARKVKKKKKKKDASMHTRCHQLWSEHDDAAAETKSLSAESLSRGGKKTGLIVLLGTLVFSCQPNG